MFSKLYNSEFHVKGIIFIINDQVIQREPWEHIKDEEIKRTAAAFVGEIWQVPPMFSAIKVSDLNLRKHNILVPVVICFCNMQHWKSESC